MNTQRKIRNIAILFSIAFGGACGQGLDAAQEGTDEGSQQAAVSYASLPPAVAIFDPDLHASGRTVCDVAGRSRACAMPQGGAGIGAGVRGGRGLQLNGGADAFAVADQPLFHLRRAVTVAAWVNPDTVDGERGILNKWYAMDSYNLGIFDGRYNFAVAFPGGTWGRTSNVGAPVLPRVWSHVAAVYDGGQQRLYVNGARVATLPLSGGDLQDSSRPLMIGNHPSWARFVGQIDDVRVYDTALSDEQIVSVAAGNR